MAVTERAQVGKVALFAAEALRRGATNVQADFGELRVRFIKHRQTIEVYRQAGGERDQPYREVMEWVGTPLEAHRCFSA